MGTMEEEKVERLLHKQKCCQVVGVRCVDESKKRLQRGHRYLINILIALFGMSSWIGIQALYVESPLLVMSSPEGSSLPIYIVVLIQLANVGWALYVFLKKFTPRFTNATYWISGVLIIDTVAMGLLACFYDVRTTVNGVEHSVVMFILVFLIAINGTFSPVLFLPYLGNFDKVHMIPYFVGSGLGGVIPSVVALIQGVGSDFVGNSTKAQNSTETETPDMTTPNFSPTVHFTVFTVILTSSTCAFWLLEYSPIARHQRVTERRRGDNDVSEKINLSKKKDKEEDSPAKSLQRGGKIYLYVLAGLICSATHGYLPSIQAYSSLPYGNVAHHLVVTLTRFADPIICGLAFWLPKLGRNGVTWISSLAFVLCSYVTWLAISSPTPLWHDRTQGTVLLLVIWVLLTALNQYVIVTIATIFRQQPGNKGLYYNGIANQVGACCGAIITFCLVNFTTIFTQLTPSA